MLNVNINSLDIITVKNINNRFIIHKISKSEAISLLEIAVLEKRGYILKLA